MNAIRFVPNGSELNNGHGWPSVRTCASIQVQVFLHIPKLPRQRNLHYTVRLNPTNVYLDGNNCRDLRK